MRHCHNVCFQCVLAEQRSIEIEKSLVWSTWKRGRTILHGFAQIGRVNLVFNNSMFTLPMHASDEVRQ